MKKLLFLLIMAAGMVATSEVKAQGPKNFTYTTIDTLKDAATIYANLYTGSAAGGINGRYENLGIELAVTEVSGTGTGYAILQSCNNTANWANHTDTAADSFAIADVASATHKWAIGDINYKYYRIKFVGTGTQARKLSGTFSVREK